MSATMKPILFSTPMVQAILDGRKTMTRRVVKSKGKNRINENGSYSYINKKDNTWTGANGGNIPQIMVDILSPYQVGDILWGRETFMEWLNPETDEIEPIYKADHGVVLDLDDEPRKWKPSIFMPREYARIFLRVTNIRVERLQDISEEDAKKEGVKATYLGHNDPGGDDYANKYAFMELWNSISGKGAWEDNPYVFVYEFERVEKPC